MCEHKTIPPLKAGVISIPLMVDYRLYNEAVKFDRYKDCFACWLKESNAEDDMYFSDGFKEYIRRCENDLKDMTRGISD